MEKLSISLHFLVAKVFHLRKYVYFNLRRIAKYAIKIKTYISFWKKVELSINNASDISEFGELYAGAPTTS